MNKIANNKVFFYQTELVIMTGLHVCRPTAKNFLQSCNITLNFFCSILVAKCLQSVITSHVQAAVVAPCCFALLVFNVYLRSFSAMFFKVGASVPSGPPGGAVAPQKAGENKILKSKILTF